MNKIKSLFLVAVTSLFALTASALDYSKLNSSNSIGGNPFQVKSPSRSGAYQHTAPNSNVTPLRNRYSTSSHGNRLDNQIRNYKQSKKDNSIKNAYSSSSHAQRLDAQIRNYRASAKENERVFGAPYRKSPSTTKKPSLDDLLKTGEVKIVTAPDGKKYLVDFRKR